MKLKKLKKLLWAVNEIAKRDIKSIKGLTKTGMEASPGHPLILMPTKGKYCLPEVRVINKIIMAIEPSDIVDEARKINLQAGILLISVLRNPSTPNNLVVLVHTPYGCCAYNTTITEVAETTEITNETNIKVEFDENIKDKFEIL